VVETLVGARILSQVLGLNVGNEEKLTYRQVLEKWYQSQGKKDGEDSLKEEITAILQGGYLEKLRGKDLDGVTLDEMVRMTNMTSEDFHRVFLSWVEGKYWIPIIMSKQLT
jgi:galactokinase